MKKPIIETITLTKVVGGGQAMGQLADGRKAFVWGGLPSETVTIASSRIKSKMIEGIVTDVVTASSERVEPRDPDSYLSTSPWQIMNFEAEQRYKALLINEAFDLHAVTLPGKTVVFTDGVEYQYRNKVEFSWYGNSDTDGNETLDIAFFQRGTHGKLPVSGTSLVPEHINQLAGDVRDTLHAQSITARSLKTLLIRCDQTGNSIFQLYVRDKKPTPDTDWSDSLVKLFDHVQKSSLTSGKVIGGEIIYSDPKSPASVITKRLCSQGQTKLTDTVLGVPFSYVCDGFFQGNIPVYEQALRDMAVYTTTLETNDRPAIVDMYSGVGSIGFTIGGDNLTLVELNKSAVDEMKRNRYELGKKATIVEASAESSLDYIDSGSIIILDPPRAGLHRKVTDRLLEVKPPRIIYLSCNPVTQARDIGQLLDAYTITYHRGYNFFPRTPHIEHLVVLDLK